MITQTIFNCNYCQGENCIITNYSSGEIVCTNCGIVHEERIIDEEYESRNFTEEPNKNTSRIGSPINFHYEDQLQSGGVILKNKKDNYLSLNRPKMSKIKKVFIRAEDLAAKLSIKSMIVEQSKDTLHRLLQSHLLKHKLLDHIIIIVFFAKLHEANMPKSLNEMKNKLGLNKEDMKSAYQLIKGSLTEKTNPIQQLKANLELYYDRMNIEVKDRGLIDQIGENIVKNKIQTENSSGALGAAIIYFYARLLRLNDITLNKIKTITAIKQEQVKRIFLVFVQHKIQLIPMELMEYSDNLNSIDLL